MSEEETQKQATVEGFSLSGEEVEHLNDKTFEIYDIPRYEEFEQDGKTKRSLLVPIMLANGTQADWYANKTSQKVIIAARGRVLNDWVTYRGKFIVKDQLVGKAERKVIYLEDN